MGLARGQFPGLTTTTPFPVTLPARLISTGFLFWLLLCFGGCSRSPLESRGERFASEARDLPPPPGLSGGAWTMLHGKVAILGGTEAGRAGASRAWLYDPGARQWTPGAKPLPPIDPDALLWSAAGCLFPGANTGEGPHWLPSGAGDAVALPPLPAAVAGARITAVTASGGRLYLALESRAASPPRLYAIDLQGPEAAWADCGEIAAGIGHVTTLVGQSNGERPHVFAFGQGSAGPALAAFEPQRGTWRTMPSPPPEVNRSCIAPIGIAHLYAFGPSANGGEGTVLRVFNTVTRVWAEPYPLPPSTARTIAATGSGTRMHALAWEPNGAARLVTVDYLMRAQGLHPADYGVILLFVVGLATMGVINSRRFRSSESYFRGGRKIPWLAAGLSVVATGQSATSFISLPARAFATNLQFTMLPLTNVFGALIMSRYFVRFFVRLNITSAYEYLQVRFSPLVHTVGSINYLAYELARISLLILVPAVAVSAVTKIDISTAILLMGAVATLYTTTGGLEGVVWADVVQILVKISAILLVLVLIFAQLEGSLLDLAGVAWREGKLKVIDWSFDLTRDSIWALILFWLTDGLKSYVANQTIIQRFISTRDERTAQRSIRASAVAGTLIFWTFMLVGTGLFLFYQQNPGRLDLTMDKPDAVFPWFIVFELPPGVAGFLITALITAALSSLYGALNSTSTVMVTDFYRRFAAQPTDAGALRLGRWLTLTVGLVATGLSLLLAGLASRSLVEQTLSVIGLFGGGLGGLFLVGMLTTRVSARAALTGFVVSAMVQYVVSRHTPLHWLTYMFTGMGSCFAAAWLASFIWPEKKSLEGLTVHTCAR